MPQVDDLVPGLFRFTTKIVTFVPGLLRFITRITTIQYQEYLPQRTASQAFSRTVLASNASGHAEPPPAYDGVHALLHLPALLLLLLITLGLELSDTKVYEE